MATSSTGKAAAWLGADRVLRTVISLTVGIAVARHLGPDGFGIIAWALAITSCVAPLASLGLETIVTRRCVIAPEATRRTVSTAIGLRLAGSAAAMAVVAALAWSGPARPAESIAVLALIAGLLPLSASEVIDAALQARLEVGRPVSLRLAAFAGSALARLLLVWLDAPLVAFAAVMAAEAAVAALLVGLLYRSRLPDAPEATAPARSLLLEAAPLIGTDLLIAAYSRADQLFLEWWGGAAALGVYAVAQRLSDAWIMLPSAYATAGFPRIVAAVDDPAGPNAQPVIEVLRRIAWSALACACATSALAWLVVPLLFGQAFRDAVLPATLLPWAGFFACLGIARGKWLIAAGLQRYSLAFIAIGGILGICLLVMLVPRFGLVGAALATVAMQAAIALLTPLLFKATRPTVTALLRALARPPGLRGW